MLKNQTIRNAWLDLIKLMASFMVVFIHIGFTGNLGIVINALARFAVPLFFVVSGFFIFGADLKTVKRRLLKIVYLYLIACAVYYLYNLITLSVLAVQNGSLQCFKQYFVTVFTLDALKNFLLFNLPFSSPHLWFLNALICVYAIWLLVVKFVKSDVIIFVIGLICLVANLVLGEGLSLFGIKLNILYVRNFALTGFPFFAFGYLASKYKKRLANVKVWLIILLLVFGTGLSVASRFLFGHNELYLGSILTAFGLLVVAIKLEDKPLNKFFTIVSTASTDVYVYHLLISYVVLAILGTVIQIGTNVVFDNLFPIIICFLCVLISLLKNFILSKIKGRKPRQDKVCQ